MDFHVSHDKPTAVRVSDSPQPCACATSTAARKPEFADRADYWADYRKGVAAAAGEVVAFS
jgi:hypothetical protein